MKYSKLSLLSIAIASYASLSVYAVETPEEAPVLDEIVVTAQKRVQKLEDVPISISTISGDKLEKSGITSAQGLSDYIPSFNMNQTGIGTNIAIRGVSSGVNQGFEQSAAMFMDGIHYGRSQLARAPFLDVARIEVLRGPQSILLGKNSTAGAISVITAKPGDKLEGSLTALYEPEYGEKDLRFVLSGPISDTVSGRMAIMNRSTDGYINNTTLNRDEFADKDRVVRATLEWKPTDSWDVTLKLEDGSFDNNGRNVEAVKPLSKISNNANPYLSALEAFTEGQYHLDSTEDGFRESNGDYSYNDTNNITLTADHTIGDLKLTSVTGYNAYSYEELCDCDFTGAPIFDVLSKEQYRQVSQELRLVSDEKQTLSWIAGIFYQSSNMVFHDRIRIPSNSQVISAAISPALLGASTQRDFNQTTDLYAAFAQATWNMTDATRLIVGGRVTQETKEADRNQYHVKPNGEVIPLTPAINAYDKLWSIFRFDPHVVSGDYDKTSFTPQLTLQHDLNKTDRVYASYTTGFKSGGFDVRSDAAPNALGGKFPDIEGTWDFKDEKVTNYELGGKFLMANGAVELNTALFRSEYTDMQTSQFDRGVSFVVTNAGAAVVQGVELDGRWAITNALLMRGGASYIDFEYTKYVNGPCSFYQTAGTNGFCDHSGLTREFVPKIQGNLGWDYGVYFANGLTLTNSLDVVYSDSYFITPDLEPSMTQPSFIKLNARIALSGFDNAWELAIIGKNLTNRTITTYANGLPLATILTRDAQNPTGAGSAFYSFYDQPRTIAVQATIKF